MRLRIEHKMILGYLPIILLIFVITIFSYRSLDELNTINRSILNEDTVLIQAVEKMGEAVLAQESYGRRYRILDNPEMLDLFRQRDREFNELVDKVRALPHQEEINIDKLLSLHRDFNALF
ncbi:MAG: MCP four helix bundle domain-containing protein, partial [Desulfococcus multivorans]|nr:MCP four helix bundle domain-containing protein [Desulfococcus multivorans]